MVSSSLARSNSLTLVSKLITLKPTFVPFQAIFLYVNSGFRFLSETSPQDKIAMVVHMDWPGPFLMHIIVILFSEETLAKGRVVQFSSTYFKR